MGFLKHLPSRDREGSDGPVLRETRAFFIRRGYVRSTPKRDAGVSHEEVYDGAALSILIWLDRASDWYVEAKPRHRDLGWIAMDDWARCLGFEAPATIELDPQLAVLQQQLARLEAACAPERLQSTIDCLRRRS